MSHDSTNLVDGNAPYATPKTPKLQASGTNQMGVLILSAIGCYGYNAKARNTDRQMASHAHSLSRCLIRPSYRSSGAAVLDMRTPQLSRGLANYVVDFRTNAWCNYQTSSMMTSQEDSAVRTKGSSAIPGSLLAKS